MSYLREGVSGEPVRILQAKLGVTVDGDFGPATDAALKAYQQKNGLVVDGVAGPDTFLHMGLGELVLLAPGAQGEAVKKLQAALGVSADGQFGAMTEKALIAFQSSHGLEADGLAGPETLNKMAAFAGEIGPAQVAASTLAPAAPSSAPAVPSEASTAPAAEAPPATATTPVTLPSLNPFSPSKPAPSKSIWATVKGWL